VFAHSSNPPRFSVNFTRSAIRSSGLLFLALPPCTAPAEALSLVRLLERTNYVSSQSSTHKHKAASFHFCSRIHRLPRRIRRRMRDKLYEFRLDVHYGMRYEQLLFEGMLEKDGTLYESLCKAN
jgi:hypothetical protein